MSENFTVFDIETPDKHHSRICSIGITRIENGQIVDSQNFLINPECQFDQFNINTHHITGLMVKDKPIFPVFWQNYGNMFNNGIVVAHGASFDLHVLDKTLKNYNLPTPEIRYIDTFRLAQKIYPNLQNYKLSSLCNMLNIELQAHNSGSDSRATAELLLKMFQYEGEEKCYQSTSIFNVDEEHKKKEFSATKAINLSRATLAERELKEWFDAIARKGTMSPEEFSTLMDWFDYYEPLLYNDYPFGEIMNKIQAILDDGVVEDEEIKELIAFATRLFNPVKFGCEKFQGDIKGKNIILSGKFDYGQRSYVAKLLLEHGAKSVKETTVTATTDILLLGNQESVAWSMGNYGNKVKRAMELQAQGRNIKILQETDVLNNLNRQKLSS